MISLKTVSVTNSVIIKSKWLIDANSVLAWDDVSLLNSDELRHSSESKIWVNDSIKHFNPHARSDHRVSHKLCNRLYFESVDNFDWKIEFLCADARKKLITCLTVPLKMY